MKIKNKKALGSFKSAGVCEACGAPCMARERHHIHSKGSGGPDLPCNIIMLGGAGQCACHLRYHDGNASKYLFLCIVAQRERTTPEAITEVVDMIRNKLPKHPTQTQLITELFNLSYDGRTLGIRQLKEAGYLE